jgi:CBS domain-containing protein
MDPLPIRRRLTVIPDGSTTSSTLVYCAVRGRSVPLSSCATCGSGGAVERDARGREVTVECGQFVLPSSRSDSPSEDRPSSVRLGGSCIASVAASLPVGLSLVRPVVCVAYDAPLEAASRALRWEPSAYGVAVVDGAHRLIGILPRATAALALLGTSDDAVAAHTTADWCSVTEVQTLSEAFAMMTSRRAREVTVVDADRAVVGTLRDIDALRFVAYVSRTGLRPPAECAA